ncbi:hypothetical protein KUTeg_013698 [Tegillarca granosa]|uniref:Uncharacterized protein n=1 Tax=Tegillarca granosa TaxID=220873 RepID=A0ABQ9EUG4_TEGGR|nr:hypothetical protein KUTeg_013698 [Tegillarca granosa]
METIFSGDMVVLDKISLKPVIQVLSYLEAVLSFTSIFCPNSPTAIFLVPFTVIPSIFTNWISSVGSLYKVTVINPHVFQKGSQYF